MNKNYLINILKPLVVVILLFKCSDAWNKSDFHIDSKLPRQCGHSKSYSSENYFEHWGFWPWLGIVIYTAIDRGSRCNSALIHPQAVITTLDCFRHIPWDNLEDSLFVVFSLPGLPSFQNISVTHIDFTGQNYNSGRSLALLKLSKPVIISANVQPVCLWEEDHDYSAQLKSQIGLMVGADIDNLFAYPYGDLRVYQAPVHVIEADVCKAKFPDYETYSTGKTLCYEYYRTPVTCHGFGSMLLFPRISESGDIVWYLRSMLTVKKWNCLDGSYTATFDVADSRKWIESHFKPSIENTCGRSVRSHTPLVTFGNQTNRGDFPWHAALFMDLNNKKSKVYRCGGSLISPSFVLTAGHCVTSEKQLLNGRLSVKLGKQNIKISEDKAQYIRVSEIILHDHYDYNTLKNDIALLSLAKEATYNEFVQPICLWENENIDKKNIYHHIGRVPGWGINENFDYPNQLYVATVPIVEDLYCLQSHSSFYDDFLTNYTLCAGNPRGNGTGVCNGDSGGGLVLPIAQEDRIPTYFLRGIVSVTIKRTNANICDPDFYAIYTDVAKYLDWIQFQTTLFN